MKKYKILRLLRKNKMVLILFLALIFINAYIIFSLEKSQLPEKLEFPSSPSESGVSECVCPIDYGKPECVNGTLLIPFFNPNTMDLKNIQVTAKKSGGLDIYNVDKPLISNRTEILHMFNCYDVDGIKVKWCCNDICCESPLNAYSEEVKLVKYQ